MNALHSSPRLPGGIAQAARAISRWLSRLGLAALGLLAALIVLRLGTAFFLHGEIAGLAGDFSRAAGLDDRIAHWLAGVAAWCAAFALVQLCWRLIGAVVWPFARVEGHWKSALVLLAVSGLGAIVPSAIQRVRSVDDQGRPARMSEISQPASLDWFSPDGTARLFFSREPDGTLRFWNREGLTPDRRLTANAVTAEIRREWERAQAANAAERKRREQAAREARTRATTEENRRQESAKAAAAKLQAARMEGQLAALRRDLDRSRSAASLRGNTSNDTPLRENTNPRQLRTERPGDAAPRPILQPTATCTLRPGFTVTLSTRGRPCTVRADVAMIVFADHPAMPHQFVPAGRGLGFPRSAATGRGPDTIHARPAGAGGVLWLRFDD